MSDNFSIRLDEAKKMFTCPKCGKKSLVKYLDYKSKKYVGELNGACIRQDECGYYSVPKVLLSNYIVNKTENDLFKMGYYKGSDGKISLDYQVFNYTVPVHRLVNSMINKYEETNFARFLIGHIKNDAHFLLKKYYVGSDFENDPLSNIFWKIDANFTIRAGLVTKIDAESGYISTSKMISRALYDEFFCVSYSNCFFGTHLITMFPEKDIALVSEERHAVICSYFWPEYNWLATGEIGNINWYKPEVFNPFINKKINVFTDIERVFFFDPIGLTYWQSIVDFVTHEIPCEVTIGNFYKEKFCLLEPQKQKLFIEMMG